MYKYIFFCMLVDYMRIELINFCKQLKLNNLEFQFLQKLKFNIKKNMLIEKYCLDGYFLVIYSNDIMYLNTLLDLNWLRLIYLSYNKFFINNMYYTKILPFSKFYEKNWEVLLLYFTYFCNIYYFSVNYLVYSLVLQVNKLKSIMCTTLVTSEISYTENEISKNNKFFFKS